MGIGEQAAENSRCRESGTNFDRVRSQFEVEVDKSKLLYTLKLEMAQSEINLVPGLNSRAFPSNSLRAKYVCCERERERHS